MSHSFFPRRFFAPLFSAMLLMTGGAVGHGQAPEPRVPMALRQTAPAPTGTHLVGAAGVVQRVPLTLVLPLRNRPALDALLRRISDPEDPLYGQYLTSAQFNAQFGPAPAAVGAVAAFAQSHGLTVTGVSSDGTLVHVTGSATAVESAFDVQLNNYVGPDGRPFHAPDREPTVPAGVAADLISVLGLSSAAEGHPAAQPTPASPLAFGNGHHFALAPRDIKSIYGLTGTPYTGKGQVAGLYEDTSYPQGDAQEYLAYYGGTATVTPIAVDGFDVNSTPDPEAVGEADLDIDMLAALAPNLTQIQVYEAPGDEDFSQSLVDTFTAVADQPAASRPSVFSISYGLSELGLDSAQFQAFDQAAAHLAALGVSICVAAGDAGAYSYQGDPAGPKPQPNISFPADDPNVLVVGGTDLTDQFDASGNTVYVSETSWADPADTGRGPIGTGGGGGVSTYYTIPSYQSFAFTSAGNPQGSFTHRNVPDVSLYGDYDTGGYDTYIQGNWEGYNGTSAASPLWAAFLADVNQARVNGGTSVIGLANTSIYRVAESSAYVTDFHDIADGSNNLFYNAVKGYDNSTGWGSFIGNNLLTDLAAGIHPGPTLKALGMQGGITLSWTAVSGATSYTLYRATTSGQEQTFAPIKTGLTGLSYTDIRVAPNVTYYYILTAVGATQNPIPSNEASASATATPGLSALASPAVVAGRSTMLTAQYTHPKTEALTYTWSAVGPAPVTYSVNGSASASVTTASFTQAGAYTFTVTITNTSGVSVYASVLVTVVQSPILVVVSPATVTLPTKQSQTFTAVGTDQFGNVIPTPPIWAVSAGGSIDAAGTFTAGAPGGPYAVSATIGSRPGFAKVTVTPVPTTSITSFSPTIGGVGTVVTITGTTLSNAYSVAFNGTPAAITPISNTQIAATVPSGATSGPITVIGSGGTATSATNFTVAPTLTGITPASRLTTDTGPLAVTLTGTYFVQGMTATLNGASVPITYVTANQATVQMPASTTAGPVSLTVTTTLGTSNPVTFSYLNPLPTITSLSPGSAPAAGGPLTLTITGTGFLGGSTVTFNGQAVAVTSQTATSLVVTVPSSVLGQEGQGQATVTVTNPGPGGGSAAAGFTVT